MLLPFQFYKNQSQEILLSPRDKCTLRGICSEEKQKAFCALDIPAPRSLRCISKENVNDLRFLHLPILRSALKSYLRCLFFVIRLHVVCVFFVPQQKIDIHRGLSLTSLEPFPRAIWVANSWVIVFNNVPVKLNLQLFYCVFCFQSLLSFLPEMKNSQNLSLYTCAYTCLHRHMDTHIRLFHGDGVHLNILMTTIRWSNLEWF